MKLIGMMLARNEGWIIGYSARVALEWCDHLIFYGHNCTDETADKLPGHRTTHRWISSSNWDEMKIRQDMLELGRKEEGTHFAIIDADEIVTKNLSPDFIRSEFEALGQGQILNLPMIPVWRGFDKHRVDPCVWTRSKITVGFCDHPDLCYQDRDGYQHHNRPPKNYQVSVNASPISGGVLHCQWAWWRRVLAKHIWYRMMEHGRWPGRETVEQLNRKYDQALDETGLKLEALPYEWHWPEYESFLDTSSESTWHEEEIKRMLDEHGREYFEGLDLRGF